MEGKTNSETAYSLSDLYIQKADICTSIELLIELHRSMCSDYAGRMRQLRRSKVYSKHVVLCIDYIYENLQKRITVGVLAKHVSLIQVFRTKTGLTPQDYRKRNFRSNWNKE